MSDDQTGPKISFVQHELPPFEAGEYQLIVEQSICNADWPSKPFKGQPDPRSYRFAVYGERFRLRPDQIVRVFPPEDSHGEYTHALPHVMLSRTTLPWERSPYDGAAQDQAPTGGRADVAPWLAVLLFGQDELPIAPRSRTGGVAGVCTVRDLLHDHVPSAEGQSDSVAPKEPMGALPPKTLSYFQQEPWDDLLDYGETPDDPCQVIDVPVDLWKRVAPTRQDLPWLAHTRTVKFGDSEQQSYALVIGNRLPAEGRTSTAHLVSLERMGAYLPDAEDPNSPSIPDGVEYIRLISLKSWQFAADKVCEDNKVCEDSFANHLKELTGTRDEEERVDGLLRRPPAPGSDPESPQAEYVQRMLAQGYTAIPYQTRTGHRTVSWYHGPLVPFRPPPGRVDLPVESADALVYLDTDRNVYDTSYGAAWQLGRLLALADRSFATGLYRWKLAQLQRTVQAAVQEYKLDRRQRTEFYDKLMSILQDPEKIKQLMDVEGLELPADLLAFLADLYVLRGIPFWYLVPDECMLPPESLRFFLVDTKWLAYLIDGATSIGRASKSAWRYDRAIEGKWFEQTGNEVHDPMAQSAPPRLLSGFLLRSQAVKGWWPGIRAEGYGPEQGEQTEGSKGPKLKQLRLELVSDSTLLALFDGEIAQVTIHEPLGGIHFGWTELPLDTGERAAGVLDVNAIAADLEKGKVEAHQPFTAAEFALQMVAKAQPAVFSLERGS